MVNTGGWGVLLGTRDSKVPGLRPCALHRYRPRTREFRGGCELTWDQRLQDAGRRGKHTREMEATTEQTSRDAREEDRAEPTRGPAHSTPSAATLRGAYYRTPRRRPQKPRSLRPAGGQQGDRGGPSRRERSALWCPGCVCLGACTCPHTTRGHCDHKAALRSLPPTKAMSLLAL